MFGNITERVIKDWKNWIVKDMRNCVCYEIMLKELNKK